MTFLARVVPSAGCAGLAVALAVTSCSRSPEPSSATASSGGSPSGASAPSPSGANAPSARVDDSTTVTLIDAGHLPRRTLRYAWQAGRREELTMDLHTTTSTTFGDARAPDEEVLPTMRVVVVIDEGNVSPDGDLHYTWTVASADVVIDPRAQRDVTDGMRYEAGLAVHVRGSGVVAPTGLTRHISIDPASLPEGGASRRMIDEVTETLRTAAAPFPEEAVGVGARWREIARLTPEDAGVTQSDTYTLIALPEDGAKVGDRLAQSVPASSSPDGGPAASMTIVGTAKTELQWARLVPTTHMRSTTTIASGASTTVLHIDMDVSGRLL